MESGLTTTNSSGGAVAGYGAYDPYSAYGEQASSQKTFLKYQKGEWTYGQNDTEVAIGTRLVANMAGLKAGWVKWWDGKPAEEQLEFVSAGVAPPTRKSLGDTDPGEWEKDNEGRPRDPWQFTNTLPMKDAASGEEYVFSTSSRGGIGAIGALCKEYGKAYRMKPGMLPVIELGSDSYKHPTYGKVHTPLLKLVEWVKEADLLSEAEPAPAEEPKRAGKTKF